MTTEPAVTQGKNFEELRELLFAKTQEAGDIYKRWPDYEEMPEADAAKAVKLGNEMKQIEYRMDALRPDGRRGSSGMPRQPGSGNAIGDAGALGRAVIDSDMFKRFDFRTRGQVSPSIDVPFSTLEQKNTITATQYAPQAVRESLILPKAVEGLSVADLFEQGITDQNAVTYMEETTFTNNAAETAEGAAKPESDLVFTERTSPVRKIATFLRVSDEMLADVNGFGAYLSQRVPMMIKMREDQQLISGNGVGANLTGILSMSGLQTQAKGADAVPDAIYKAITLIRSNAFLEPDGIIVHPADWQDIRTLRTADGLYIFGNPSDVGAENIFGLRVVITTRMTQNTLIVGAFRTAAKLYRREALRLALSTEDASNFTSNLVTVLAELRETLVAFRGSGFCQVTGV